jgi:hypothetical protein
VKLASVGDHFTPRSRGRGVRARGRASVLP